VSKTSRYRTDLFVLKGAANFLSWGKEVTAEIPQIMLGTQEEKTEEKVT
jgi:hypothetical protein